MQQQQTTQNGNNKMNQHNLNRLHKLHRKHSTVIQRAMSGLLENKNQFGYWCPCRRNRSDSEGYGRSNESDDNNTKGDQNKSWDELEYSERQDRVETLDLFRYAQTREIVAILVGVLFMIYAASWQPISVFILAIMASLMGQYSKQTSWLIQLNSTTSGQHLENNHTGQPILSSLIIPALSNGRASPPQINLFQTYDSYSFLGSLASLVMPVFDGLGSSSSSSFSTSSTNSSDTNNSHATEQADHIKSAVHDILELESQQFLRKSFEINGSAFVLALTQLAAFFLGMSLITWAAKKQASRIKILYFNSCLHQEVTWFEAIDSASGSGSSLNGLVEKFEDGIGMKLALLCYFLGHVTLFTLTAFYQMFSLAAFCMPFVLAVGLIIVYLSDRQAAAIGQHALFAKRSMQLAEEILAAIRTVFAFNGQQKEITRYSLSFEPVYRKSLIKHLYTALNTSLSKFSIFACFAAYCFYAKRLFPPYSDHANPANKSTILAVMRGAEVSIVNILISIPFMEALQQSKGSIARIYVAIERRSRINASSGAGLRLDYQTAKQQHQLQKQLTQNSQNGSSKQHQNHHHRRKKNHNHLNYNWQPSISFRMIQFGYADRSGPTRRRSTLPFLNLPNSIGDAGLSVGQANNNTNTNTHTINNISNPLNISSSAGRRKSVTESSRPNISSRRQSFLDELADGVTLEVGSPGASTNPVASSRRQSAIIRRALGQEVQARCQGNKRVLNYFNLEIKAGQSVALVGPSGSGKSTVLALVQRLYDITGGQLLIGQHNIKDLSVAWLRNQIGVVAQEPRLFDMTIAENIMLGLTSDDSDLARLASDRNMADCLSVVSTAPSAAGGAGPSLSAQHHDEQHDEFKEDLRIKRRVMQQVVEAAQAAGAHQFIVKMPNGYATRVGSAGVQLSGGQKQRIAIARALIRKPKILLLDECTSALDTESEAQVQAAIKRASSMSNLTTLIVAHRLETIKHVDLIVVMNEGQVVECGTHDELMQSDGDHSIYKRMYLEQLRAVGVNAGHQLKCAIETLPEISIGVHGDDQNDGGQRKPARRDSDNSLDDQPDKRTQQQQQQRASKCLAISSTLEQPIDDTDSRRDCRVEPATKTTGTTTSTGCKQNRNDFQANKAEKEDREQRNNETDDASSSSMSSSMADEDSSSSSSSISGCSLASTYNSGASSNGTASIRQLWQFIEPPKWTALISVIVCLLAGLILPLNLIAHSYLFSVFAYNELDQIGEYLHVFGLLILSFSTFVFICSFLQVLLPGYVGEKMSARLSVKTMDSLLQKPMFYFDMDSNSAGSLCNRFNSYIGNLQAIAGSRVATILEATSTLCAGAFFGFGQNVSLSMFCLSFALFVLITTIIESKIVERESALQRDYDAQLAHLMADALSNIKTIASLNKEQFFIDRFKTIVFERERGSGKLITGLRNFLTSLKFVMPALSWSASMYYGCCLLASGQIDLQTIFIVCPVVLFAVNDTFRALVFLPELLKARQSIKRLYKMNVEFSPQVLQALTFSQQLEEQNRLHLEQQQQYQHQMISNIVEQQESFKLQQENCSKAAGGETLNKRQSSSSISSVDHLAVSMKPKKSISFALEPPTVDIAEHTDPSNINAEDLANPMAPVAKQLINRRLSNLAALPSYMSARRKSSRLNSLIPRAGARGRILFKQVDFAYPNRPSALVLDQFTLTIEPGESVALVGASGSGKSTTVTILEKFYDYHSGEVQLDGRDLRLVDANWVRSQIGLVSQEPCLLSYSIADNIRYGDNSRFVTMDEVVQAARTANIHDFIMSLPDQYDTQLTSSAYSNSQLSGGQRQRISIARALVRQAPILIFDEATSALDQHSEQVVQDALTKARRGRTSLTIAHRLATIRDSDKIVVMRDGRIVECGKHDHLIARPNGYYRSLWQRQEGLPSSVDT